MLLNRESAFFFFLFFFLFSLSLKKERKILLNVKKGLRGAEALFILAGRVFGVGEVGLGGAGKSRNVALALELVGCLQCPSVSQLFPRTG